MSKLQINVLPLSLSVWAHQATHTFLCIEGLRAPRRSPHFTILGKDIDPAEVRHVAGAPFSPYR
jgi:hypothetical protein